MTSRLIGLRRRYDRTHQKLRRQEEPTTSSKEASKGVNNTPIFPIRRPQFSESEEEPPSFSRKGTGDDIASRLKKRKLLGRYKQIEDDEDPLTKVGQKRKLYGSREDESSSVIEVIIF